MVKRKRKYTRKTVPLVPLVLTSSDYLSRATLAEPNERRKRFLVALAATIDRLMPDDIDNIEVTLRRVLGRMEHDRLVANLPKGV